MDGNVVINKTLTVVGNTTVGNLTVNGHFAIMNCLSYLMNTTQTTNATAKTITIVSTTTNTVYLMKARVLGLQDSNVAAVAFDYQRGYKNDAGVVNQLPGTDNVSFKDSGTGTWNLTFTISGTNVLIQVNGQAGKTINWSSCVEIYQYKP
jgi:hypothetical protein